MPTGTISPPMLTTTVKQAMKGSSPGKSGKKMTSGAMSKRSDDYDDEYYEESDESEGDKQDQRPADTTVKTV